MSDSMPRSSKCPKCSESLIFDYESYCLNCGYRYSEHPNPSNLSRASKNASAPAQPDLASPLPDQDVQSGAQSCINAAYKTLRLLRPPFTYIEDEGLFRGVTTPCFFYSPKFRKATEGISDPWDLDEGERYKQLHKMATLTKKLPVKVRKPVWILLRRCDSRLREATNNCDIEVGLYLDIIRQEQERINILRSTAQQTTLFTFSLNDSLLRYCDSVQVRLEEAARLVEEVRTVLEPAKMFFLNQRSGSRQELKHRLLKLLLENLPITRKEAAAKVAELLALADPKRPAKAGSIRNL